MTPLSIPARISSWEEPTSPPLRRVPPNTNLWMRSEIDRTTHYVSRAETYSYLPSIQGYRVGFDADSGTCLISQQQMHGDPYARPVMLRAGPRSDSMAAGFYDYDALLDWIDSADGSGRTHPVTRAPLTLDNIRDYAVAVI